jgi:hypothetical protein
MVLIPIMIVSFTCVISACGVFYDKAFSSLLCSTCCISVHTSAILFKWFGSQLTVAQITLLTSLCLSVQCNNSRIVECFFIKFDMVEFLICQDIPVFVKTRQQYLALYMKTCMCSCVWDWQWGIPAIDRTRGIYHLPDRYQTPCPCKGHWPWATLTSLAFSVKVKC